MDVKKYLFLTTLLLCTPLVSMEHDEKHSAKQKSTPTSSPTNRTIAAAAAIKAPTKEALSKEQVVAKLKEHDTQELLKTYCKGSKGVYPTISDWVAKTNFQREDRIQGARKLQAAIKKHNLDQLDIVEHFEDSTHYQYHSHNTYRDDDGYLVEAPPIWVTFVLAKDVKDNKEKITLEQAKQLYTLAEKTSWKHILHSYVKTAPGKITLINTQAGWDEQPNRANLLSEMLKEKHKFDAEAVRYLENLSRFEWSTKKPALSLANIEE